MGDPIETSDLTWLLMDRPNNLMHVHSLMEFDELPPFQALQDAIFDRAVWRYPVLSQHPVHVNGRWEWHDDLAFSMDNHVQRVYLDDWSGQTLHRYLSSRFSLPFDRGRPLWDFQVISGPAEDDRADGVVFCRFHHALGDGVRLTQLLLGLSDPADGLTPPLTRRRSDHSTGETMAYVTKHSILDAVDYVRSAGEVVGSLGKSVISSLDPRKLPERIEASIDLVKHPVKVSDALTSIASEDNELANSVREITRMVFHEKADSGAWEGQPSGVKAIDWFNDISLPEVKRVAKHFDATVNDVLMALVSLALTAYLRERGVKDVRDLAWLMPVSLRPLDASLPATLGNHFAVVLFDMPLGFDDPAELIDEVHHRANRLKNSAEPALAFGVQRVIAESPGPMAKAVTDFFANKTIGQLSNVPGPRKQIAFAGARVRNIIGWVPTSSDQPLGVCMFSYNDKIGVGVAGDTRMIPDPTRITQLMVQHLDRLRLATDKTAPRGKAARAVAAPTAAALAHNATATMGKPGAPAIRAVETADEGEPGARTAERRPAKKVAKKSSPRVSANPLGSTSVAQRSGAGGSKRASKGAEVRLVSKSAKPAKKGPANPADSTAPTAPTAPQSADTD